MALRPIRREARSEKEFELNTDRAQAAYLIMSDLLDAERFLAEEVVVAALTLIAVQYNRGPIPQEDLTTFILEGAGWCRDYWRKG